MPFWFGFLLVPSIGTMGAFIRIKEAVSSRVKFFDIGIAGPLAGFVAALGVLSYGFTHLPPPEYIFEIHPEYAEYGLDYADHVYQDETLSFKVGNNLLFAFFEKYVATDPASVPNHDELVHYPWFVCRVSGVVFYGNQFVTHRAVGWRPCAVWLIGQPLA